jgi:hypothetical protein
MVDRQSVCHPSASVVGEHIELLEPQPLHHHDLVSCHGSLGVIAVVRQTLGFRGVAISSEVCHHHGVGLDQTRGNPVPNGVGLRVSVQQQQWRAVACDAGIDLHLSQVNELVFEIWEELGHILNRVGVDDGKKLIFTDFFSLYVIE